MKKMLIRLGDRPDCGPAAIARRRMTEAHSMFDSGSIA